MMIDISPSADRIAALLGSVAERFSAVARKENTRSAPPRPDAANLEAGWRDRIVRDLDTLADVWRDIAVSTGQPYEPSVSEIEAASSFVTSFDAPRDGNLFGPVVSLPDAAPPLDRLLGLTGRDPDWRPSTR